MSDIELVQEDFIFDAPVKSGERFEVKTTENALWCEGKLARAEEDIQRNIDTVEKIKAKLDKWLEARNKPLVETIDIMMGLMRPWVEKEVASGKKKSIDLLEHRIGFRDHPEHLEVKDEQSAIFALEIEHPECVKVEKTILKKNTTALIKQGFHVEGCEVKNGERSYYIEPLKK